MTIFLFACRYHDRYYPENIYNDDRAEYEEEERVPARQQVSLRVLSEN